ncbi:hypothetical protein G9A89_015152 [Geosiphon pyriformis]|nr:hypothetical protein G9A89_015152 [Geosiphon pyriformis]
MVNILGHQQKGKQKEEHTWETTINTWNKDDESEFTPTTSWKEKEKDKSSKQTTNTLQVTSGWTKTYDISCQYTIFISDWVSCGTPITAAWHRAISHLDGYLHDEDEIWQMANAKVEGAMSSEILKIKNNPPEPVKIILVPNPDAFFDIKTNSENFHKHYQNLAPTREEQEERLAQLNT